ncbi:MAG TPA: proline--tRNA ligase [Rickettsiales bacterium]|nr:proline--tRNA ligase [Rickettsiales bacterium]
MKHALNITREENFADWYQEVVSKADLAETSSTKGAMVVKPYGCAIWENIKNILDEKLKSLGVQNAMFPALIPVELLEKEAEHVSGFAKECVVITHHRLIEKNGKLEPDGELERPYILRPTSETIIGESFSKWVKSYRDLPLLINQWANVFRWEMRTRMFLRTSEFFWQEGHCVFTNEKAADENARKMLEVYDELLRNYFAISGVNGEKTEDEKFAGALKTYTIETMMQDGKALQTCTSHNLGQNFAHASEIKFTDENTKEQYAWTSSWGLSTRTIGALILSHSDDDGLVLPPKLAPYQVVIIPVVHNENKKNQIIEYCNKIKNSLNCRVLIDESFETPQNKKWNWVRKGAPLRLEIGERDNENNSIFFARRDRIIEKNNMSFNEFVGKYQSILDDMQATLLQKNKDNLKAKTVKIETLEELKKAVEKEVLFFNIPSKFFGNEVLTKLMEENALSFRCIPFEESDRIIVAKSY